MNQEKYLKYLQKVYNKIRQKKNKARTQVSSHAQNTFKLKVKVLYNKSYAKINKIGILLGLIGAYNLNPKFAVWI